MSFNANDIIHLGNYEEFFILYLDNELSAEQRLMVEQFVEENPALRAELDLFAGTKLPEEELVMDKSLLFADQMTQHPLDEDLLLFIDNELPASRKKTVELELELNPSYATRYQQYQQTKLDPSEKIAFPDKSVLYRRESRVIGMAVWIRIAAAVVILLSMSIFLLNGSNQSKNTGSMAIQVPKGSKALPVQGGSISQPGTTSGSENELANQTVTPDAGTVSHADEVVANRTTTASVKTPAPAPVELRKEPALAMSTDAPVNTTTLNREYNTLPVAGQPLSQQATASLQLPAASSHQAVVTSSPDERITTESTNNDATVAGNDEKKGSLKGFFRKATRVFAKKTGIDPTSGDDELLIGALAVKLK